MPTSYQVKAMWDDEAGVFVSQSDIPGLVIEAATSDEFVQLVNDLAPDLIAHNLPGAERPYKVQVHVERDFLLDVA